MATARGGAARIVGDLARDADPRGSQTLSVPAARVIRTKGSSGCKTEDQQLAVDGWAIDERSTSR